MKSKDFSAVARFPEMRKKKHAFGIRAMQKPMQTTRMPIFREKTLFLQPFALETARFLTEAVVRLHKKRL